MTEYLAHQNVEANAAECLRCLARYRTHAAQNLGCGPGAESMAHKLLELARRLDETQGGAGLQLLSSERALLMDAVSSMAPLLDLARESEVSPDEMPEPERCARSLEVLIAMQAGTAAPVS